MCFTNVRAQHVILMEKTEQNQEQLLLQNHFIAYKHANNMLVRLWVGKLVWPGGKQLDNMPHTHAYHFPFQRYYMQYVLVLVQSLIHLRILLVS